MKENQDPDQSPKEKKAIHFLLEIGDLRYLRKAIEAGELNIDESFRRADPPEEFFWDQPAVYKNQDAPDSP